MLVVPEPKPAVRRESLTEQTVSALREAILDGTYKLGQKLRENELLGRFNVSSSVIREALHVLQGEGIVVTRAYRGRSVFDLAPGEGSELLVMRAWLESYAAFLAARKMNPTAAQQILDAAARFSSHPPLAYNEWVDRELGFHRAIWRASGNDWLVRQLDQFSVPILALRIIGVFGRDAEVKDHWQDSQNRETPDNPAGHQLLARTMANGEAQKSRKLMLLHILGAVDHDQLDIFDCSGVHGSQL